MIPNATLDLIFKRTEEALTQQQDVPLSPGRKCANGQVLCAGAMLVHEALLVLQSAVEAAEFARRVTGEDPSFIEDTGELIGLDRDMVVETKRMNDSLVDENRLRGTINALRELRQPLRS